MRIAIIGAGFCGLATAWHLLNQSHSPLEMVIFDAKGIGAGASGVAAGLLHPYGGAHAKLNRLGREGLQATLELLNISANALQTTTFASKGILRLALTEGQRSDFALSANKYPEDIEWLEPSACSALYPSLAEAPGIWIKHGISVHTPLYLKGLWQACANQGAVLYQQTITSLEELNDFDMRVIATGADSLIFPEMKQFALNVIKGQILELEWPEDLAPLPFALNSQAYLMMNEDQRTCTAGATFEREYQSLDPDVEVARQEIIPKVTAMIPALSNPKILKCKAGCRVVTPDHLPLMQKIDAKTWTLTGMGSKGLLYHAYFAKRLATEILKSQET